MSDYHMDLLFYILMRTDMDSMNPGKACAQASHAYGALAERVRANPKWGEPFLEWQKFTPQDFGTTITLGGNEGGIMKVLGDIHRFNMPLVAGWVHDPSYPVQDGEVTHLLPINTCAFVFGAKATCKLALRDLKLHP